MGKYLGRYKRCRVQGQEYYIDTWCEKDALSQIFEDVAWPYCIRHTTCRGFDSATALRKFAERARDAISRKQWVVLLYFGDFDPSGLAAGDATQQSLLELSRTAVTEAQENLRLVRVKYRNGDATPTDIVDAETALTRSQQRYNSALYNYLTALAGLDYAMGRQQGTILQPASVPKETPEPLPKGRPISWQPEKGK